MKNVIVVGAGFAGLSAIRELRRVPKEFDIFLFDKNTYTTMIPSLPDLAGAKLPETVMRGDIRRLIPERVTFKQEVIHRINLNKKTVISDKAAYTYDYLIIACGSTTNFYGFNKHLERIYRLDDLAEATRIRDNFAQYLEKVGADGHVVLSGAGYTGIELACSLRHYAHRQRVGIPITIVEVADKILPFLNDSDCAYIREYIETMDINLQLNSRVTDFDGTTVTINNARTIANAFFCWTAGSKSAIEKLMGNVQSLGDGRMIVNQCLQLRGYDEVFAVGDAAAIEHRGAFLRKAVNFSLDSGKHAGKNLVRMVKQRALQPFRPVDLGWVIPLHDISVGFVFNRIPVRGRLGLRLHYFMSGYRNYSFKNFLHYACVAARLF